MSRRIGWLSLVFGFAAGASLLFGCGTIRAGRMVLDAIKPASELAPEVTESIFDVEVHGDIIPATVYRPKDAEGPLPAVVLIHGAVTGGAGDPRFIALARAMAIRGGTIVTPDLASLRRFRLDPLDPDRVAAVGRALADRKDLAADGRVAFIGISVGGAYGLLASTDPALAGRVSTILTFGAYADLNVLIRRWMTDPSPDVPELLGPQTYGRRLVLRGNLEVLAPEPDRPRLSAMIERLLTDQAVDEVPRDLSPAGLRVAEVAVSEGPIDPAIVSALLRPLESDIRALSPVNRAEVPDVPVYLLHGEQDPVVSVADLEQLAAHLEEHGVEVEVHRTEVFSHVKRMGEGRPSIFQAWPLFSFLADVLSDAGF